MAGLSSACSADNQAEVAKPYIEAGLVDYFFMPGKVMQLVAYNDAVKRFKFECRYMAFIDLDEFIFPRTGQSISEVVDEILLQNPNAAGLAVNWNIYGSNNLETADYSRGVLDRFTRRAHNDWHIPKKTGTDAQGNIHVKVIANPRRINYFDDTPHCPICFQNSEFINELGQSVDSPYNLPVTTEKIVINHYHVKSKQEYALKIKRGRPTMLADKFQHYSSVNDRNEVFDDGILKYRALRAESFFLESESERFNRVTEALTETLVGKNFDLEAALTCRALSSYLRGKYRVDAEYWKICEEKSLGAILKSVGDLSLAEARLLISDLPNLLNLPYPAVKKIRGAALEIIPQLMDILHLSGMCKDYVELDYVLRLLKNI